MAKFAYTAVGRDGVKVKGEMEAGSENELRVSLRGQNLRPLKIQKAAATSSAAYSAMQLIGGRISDTDVLLVTRQLSILIGAGIPLVQGLEIISSQVEKPALKNLIIELREKISGGSFLWESLAAHPLAFSSLYISMVKAGESSGSLEVILKRLMLYLEDAIKLRKMVKGAMIYPVSVLVVGIAVVFIMLTFVIPKFEEMLAANNQELPDLTRIVINLSHFCANNFFYIVATIALMVFLVRSYMKTEEGQILFDKYILVVPLFGTLIQKVSVARFCRTMQTMLTSGINLLDSIDICRGAVGNRTYGTSLAKVKSEVESGKTLAIVLAKLPIYPHMMVQMVTIGETTGNLDSMLAKVADYYEEEVMNLVGNMTKLIEPFILVFLGGSVAVLMIAMYLPIFKMAG